MAGWPEVVCARAGAPRHAESNANASHRAVLQLFLALVFALVILPVLVAIGLLTDTVRSFAVVLFETFRTQSMVAHSHQQSNPVFFLYQFFFSSDAQTSLFGASNDKD